MAIKQLPDGKLECPKCFEPFDSARALSNHIRLIHKIPTKEFYDEYAKELHEGTCIICGQPTTYRDLMTGYKDTCSHKCAAIALKNDPEKVRIKRERTEKTSLARYGVKNGGGSTQALEKSKQTNLKKRGVEYAMQDKSVQQKATDTFMERYNASTYLHSDTGAKAVKQTCQAKFGADNFFGSEQGKQAVDDWNQKTYGTRRKLQNEQYKNEWMADQRAKFDGKIFVETDDFKKMSYQTQVDHYGTWYSASSVAKSNVVQKYKDQLAKFDCILEYVINKNNVCFKCNKCQRSTHENTNFIKLRILNNITPCPYCYSKSSPSSYEEHEIKDFITSLGFTTNHYDRNFIGPYGADIVIESKKLIIEYDGLHWHNELYRPSNYHYDKTITAIKQGYRLIHIFSDEWIFRQEIVKSRLKSILGIYPSSIYARKCNCRQVDSKTTKQFLNENHLQGGLESKWKYGLYYNGDLIAIMTFGANRFGKHVEMYRYCTKLGYQVVGGASKLFKKFVTEHTEISEIVSFADARWSTSHAFYTKLGFNLDSISKPGYYIVDGDIRRNRLQFQRHKIAGPNDEGKTEHEITLERGLYRIYDCGQYKFIWKR